MLFQISKYIIEFCKKFKMTKLAIIIAMRGEERRISQDFLLYL